ncbi:MAG TPA: efflux RND transporter periplasmic adaptor subunit [Bacteroidia bacterium]|nr:efflux RND transporter periplasmic adaptor subunit [Bacteroidia bacterium]
MKKVWTWVIVIAAIVLLIVFKPSNKDAGSVQQNQKSIGAVTLVEGKVIRMSQIANEIDVTGTILSNEEVTLQSQIAGIVSHISFTEGSKVSKGELLIKIDDSQLQAQLEKDEVAKQLAELTEQRQKKLLTINGISQQDYDIALNNLKSVEADIKMLQVQISYTEIRAPFDGVIGLRNVSEGSYISQNTVLVNMEEISPVKVDFFVPAKYTSSVQRNDVINFTVSGYNDVFQGKIYALDPKVDESTRTLHLRALADNKDGKLLPGSFANIKIELNHSNTALMIPTEAVIPQISGQSAYISKNGIVSSTAITLGIRTDSTVEVVKGISGGDTIITRGLQFVHPGSAVKFKVVR